MKRGTSQNPETRHCTGEAPPTEGSSTLGVPWAQQTLRQDWDPAAQRPSPNHPVPAPSTFSQAYALHPTLSAHAIQTTRPLAQRTNKAVQAPT